MILGTVYKAWLISVCVRRILISLKKLFIQNSQSRPNSAACVRPNFYAVKCINRKSLTKTTQDLLINEIKLLKHIKHENIVEMYDFQVNQIFNFSIFDFFFPVG